MSPFQRDAIAEALKARLDALSPEKRALAEQRLREAHVRKTAISGIPRLPEGQPAPLSFQQERLWRLEQAAPGSANRNVTRAMYVRGAVNVERLRRALDKLVERHAVLRTIVIDDGGDGRQMTLRPRPVPLALVDLLDAPATTRMNDLHTILQEHASRSFDLSKDLLLRASLVTMTMDEHALLLVSHQIAADETSGAILTRDLDVFYRGADGELAPLPIHYTDFAAWQRAQLTDARTNDLIGYWRERLVPAPPALELPTDRPRAAAPSVDGARSTLRLSRDVADAVYKTARVHATTPVVVLLAAFQVLLHRYARRNDIIVGTMVTGREHSVLEELVGCFSSTVPLRVSINGEQTFTELLFQVRDASQDASDHADLPYETIALSLPPAERGSAFDVAFAMTDARASLSTLGDATLTGLAVARGTAQYDLTLAPAFADEGLRIVMEYRTALFDASTIERMLSHYGVLLTEATLAAQTTLARLPLLPAAERELVVKTWNRTEVAYPQADTLVSLFETQALRSPGSIAVALPAGVPAAGPRTLTFAELDARSTTLARALVARGVQRGAFVGVCMEPGLELATAMVGVLKAGGVYVPFDPGAPAARLVLALADTRCTLLLTQGHIADGALASLPRGDAVQPELLSVDRDWAAVVSGASTLFEPMPRVEADDIAYMVYTPDSGGKPAGAMTLHRGIANRLEWMRSEHQITAADSVLHSAPLDTDVAVWELLLPLVAGARVVMARLGAHRDAPYLAEEICAERITIVHISPSMLRAFLNEPGASQCGETLRDVLCSGETMTYGLEQRFFAVVCGDGPTAHRVGLHRLYAPPECAGGVSHWSCVRDDVRRVVPIGRPIANTRLYVLDAAMQPVPVGVAGELYVGGVQVGAGYWERTDLTAERFVPDPFAGVVRGQAGAQLYRTRELARWLPDGVVEHVGPMDP